VARARAAAWLLASVASQTPSTLRLVLQGLSDLKDLVDRVSMRRVSAHGSRAHNYSRVVPTMWLDTENLAAWLEEHQV
jgi:hypothetical protein